VFVVAAGFPAWAATLPVATLPTVPATKGGTDQTVYVVGDTLYASAVDALSRLAGNITVIRKFLRQVGNGAASAAPAWDTLTAADIAAGTFPAGVFSFADLVVTASLRLGGSASADTLGEVVKKLQVYDSGGVSLGYVAVFDAIS
jgi:hypothetical protein